MDTTQIIDVIIAIVGRYASLRPATASAPIDADTRPYYDLSMDSFHDLNIVCEVEATLGVKLPERQKLLASGDRALSIREAADSVSKSFHSQSPTDA